MFENTVRRPYEDLVLGEIRYSPPKSISEEAIVTFAKQFDPQWFHVDPVKARKSIFGGLIASGAHLLALWRRMDHDMNGDIDYCCGLALEDIKFLKAVRADDVLILESRIVARRLSLRKNCGLVTMAYQMANTTGEPVLTLSAINLVYRRSSVVATG